MIDFIVDHKTAIILLIIGAVIGVVIQYIIETCLKYIKNSIKKLYQLIKDSVAFLIRRIKGNYNLNDIERISLKPEDKRSKWEQKALEEYDKLMEETVKTRFRIDGVNLKR